MVRSSGRAKALRRRAPRAISARLQWHAAASGLKPLCCRAPHLLLKESVLLFVESNDCSSVSLAQGNTYERTAIEAWLQRSQTSPITRSYLSTSMLNSNRALREAIEALRQQRGEPIPTVAPSASAAALAAAEPAPDIPEEMITMSAKQFRMDANIGVEICVEPPKGSVSMPMDIVLVVDVSGSMDAAAMVDQGGQPVDVGFSVMDITKHALNTVIEALKPQDRMCIVAFSTSATVVMPMTQMVRANQDRAKALVAAMQPGGTTNLWDGMRVALRELETSHRGGSHMTSIFVLTDGVPTEHLNPPRGILETLKKHLAKSMPEARGDALLEGGPEQDSLATSSTIPPSIYTFGFGYALDTKVSDTAYTYPDMSYEQYVHVSSEQFVTIGRYVSRTVRAIFRRDTSSCVTNYRALDTHTHTHCNCANLRCMSAHPPSQTLSAGRATVRRTTPKLPRAIRVDKPPDKRINSRIPPPPRLDPP